jgi:hypothetical protein
MSYRVRPDGIIETDTAEEALVLSQLLSLKPTKPSKPNGKSHRKPRKKATKEPSQAEIHGVKLGQVWKATGGNSKDRVIQITKLLKDKLGFKILENAPGVKTGRAIPMLYSNLAYNYKLEKDI